MSTRLMRLLPVSTTVTCQRRKRRAGGLNLTPVLPRLGVLWVEVVGLGPRKRSQSHVHRNHRLPIPWRTCMQLKGRKKTGLWLRIKAEGRSPDCEEESPWANRPVKTARRRHQPQMRGSHRWIRL